MQQVQVRVSERGALANGRFSFTDRYTLVSELLQNARRAGASLVIVEHDVERRMLTVSDDGRGVDDFQDLLTFNESGWDADTVEREHAFGVGFSKALYAARFVSIGSKGQRLAFTTADALAQRPLDVAADPEGDPSLTVVRLEGVDLDELRQRIERIVCGFPVPVSFNGILLPRPYAIDALPYSETTIGSVHLPGFHSGKACLDRLVFLQGMLVRAPSWWSCVHCSIVHLDPRQFTARLPDRTQLIDTDEQMRRIEAAVRALWREVLVRRKAQLGGAAFIDRFFELASRQGHQDLFNDIPLLPRQVCDQIVDYPVQAASDPPGHLRASARNFGRDEVENGEIRLTCLDEPDEGNLAHWMFARARGFVLVRAYRLDEAHWVHEHLRVLQDEPVELTIHGEQQRFEFDGRFIWTQVVLCASYSLAIGEEQATFDDEALCHDGIVVVPADESSGRVVRQVSSYLDDEERPRDEDLAADEHEFAQVIRRLRADDPARTLVSLLEEVDLDRYPLLAGRTFRLRVGHSVRGHAVEVID